MNSEALLANYKWRSCGAVGNSGVLGLAEWGNVIDSHDIVLRANQVMMTRAEFRSINILACDALLLSFH